MATLEREEGDYTYWSDGAVRYAGDNSQGKQKGSLAKRPPYAAERIDKLPPRKQRQVRSNGGKASWEKRRLAIAESYAVALREIHPDYQTEEDGLLDLARAAIEQGTDSEGGGPPPHTRTHRTDRHTAP